MAGTHFDVVIIGSGAGGAPIAAELAARGKTILVLDKGPHFRTQGERAPDDPADFKRDEMFNAGHEKIIRIPGAANEGQPFYHGPVEPDLNDEPHMFSVPSNQGTQTVTIEGYTAQCVGGGTQLYGAVSLRFAPDDFRIASVNSDTPRTLGDDPGDTLTWVLDWPVAYDELRPFYEKAERLVGINGTSAGQGKPFGNAKTYQKPKEPSPISVFAKAGMDKLGFEAYRTPLAVITEDHTPSGRTVGDRPEPQKTAYVNRYGDPMGYKSNTWVALLRPAIEGGNPIDLRPNCHVTHLKSSNDRVTGVVYRGPSGEEVEVSGEIVVVACSAVESVRLLMISSEEDRAGFGTRMRYDEPNSNLGRFFLTHCFGGAEVAIPREVAGQPTGAPFDKSISLDSDWATDALSDPDWVRDNKLWAGGAIYNNTSDQALPVTLARNHRSTDLDTNWLGFAGDTGLYGDAIRRWLDKDFGTRLSVSFMANQVPHPDNLIKLSTVRDKWGRPAAHIVKDWRPHDGFLMKRFAQVCEEILLAGVPGVGPDDVEEGSVYGNGVRIANHVLGGARFGTDRTKTVLDPGCRVWDFDNLYVTDGAFMPTSGGANPTLTIQANAFRVADLLAARL